MKFTFCPSFIFLKTEKFKFIKIEVSINKPVSTGQDSIIPSHAIYKIPDIIFLNNIKFFQSLGKIYFFCTAV